MDVPNYSLAARCLSFLYYSRCGQEVEKELHHVSIPQSNLSNFLLLSFSILVLSCKTMRPALTVNHHTYIACGSLGGFAGSYTECRIMPDGSAFKKTRYNGEFVQQKRLTGGTTDQLFALFEKLKTQDVTINDPGNLTYFIKWEEKEESMIELIWGGEEDVVAMVELLHSNMNRLCVDQGVVR